MLVFACACGERTSDTGGAGDAAPRGPLEPGERIVRLGSVEGRARVADASYPALQAPGGKAVLPLSGLPASRILLAVARTGGASARCSAWLLRESDPVAGPPAAVLALPAGEPAWAEGRARLPSGFRGRLRLHCTQEGTDFPEVAWAQPVVVPEAPASPPPLVVLLSLDTLRADRVPGFGGEPELAPNLGRLAAEGVRMTDATAWGTWTLPSHTALLLLELRAFEVPEVDEPGAGDEASLAMAFRYAGYTTVGITGGGWVSAQWGFDHAFERYVEHRTVDGADLERVLADAREAIAAREGAPTFLFLHSYVVHQLGPDAQEHVEEHGPFAPIDLDEAALARERAAYDRYVRDADRRLGRFLDFLREAAKRRPLLLVVVSDHGEALGEHGTFGHGRSAEDAKLHDELVRIPMIAWGPGIVPGGRASDRPTMLLDVAPTLIEAVGLPVPDWMLGESLWPYWSGAREAPPSSPGSVTRVGGTWSLRSDTLKLIAAPAPGEDGGERLELYDLVEDPHERRDLAGEQPERARAARERLRARLAGLGIEPAAPGRLPRPECWAGDRSGCAQPARDAPELPSAEGDLREQLRGLGYVE